MANLKDAIDRIVAEISSMTQEELLADFNAYSDGAFSEIHNEHGLTFKSPFSDDEQTLNIVFGAYKFGAKLQDDGVLSAMHREYDQAFNNILSTFKFGSKLQGDGVFSEVHLEHRLAVNSLVNAHYQIPSFLENLESANETPFELAA
jgi:hypothetical protein